VRNRDVNGKNMTKWLAVLLCTAALGYGAAFGEELSRKDIESRLVSFSVENGKAVDILKLLAAQNKLNLTVSEDVQGTVTIALVDVPLTDALDAISASVSASWYIAGNIIVVKPSDKIDPRELETRLFRLQFIPADEAKAVVTQLIPESGKVEALSRGKAGETGGWDEMLQVTTFSTAVAKVADLISKIDKPRPQVEIEVKIIETDIADNRTLGVDFPDYVSFKAGDMPEELEVEGVATRSFAGGDWAYGRMTAGEVVFLLDMLIQNGRSKLISNPRVTTLSNQQAEIVIAQTIPVQTLNRFSEGGVIQDIVTFQDLDVSISLIVTPRVSDDSTITLDVSSQVEEITGYTGPTDNQRPITSKRTVTSSVTVKAGESLGLGGLVKEVEHKTIGKLPLLGSIPFIGTIFQHHKTVVEKTDLTIIITPKLVDAS
jgi:type II secretory pathway component GspD/PulD (secretin)